jgi:hypothetical protein
MKLPALRVELNGELVAVAGAEGLSLLSGQVGFGAGSANAIHAGAAVFSVIGLALGGEQPRQLSWANNVQLNLGDKVTFQVVEVEHPSPASQTLKVPSSEQLARAAAAEKQPRGRP